MSPNHITWLAVSHLQTVSIPKLLRWLDTNEDYQSLFASSTSDLQHFGFTSNETNKIKQVPWQTIEAECKWFEQHGHILTIKDPVYPRLLREIADPPLVLYIRGDVTLLSLPQIAIVGSRNPSPIGFENGVQFAKVLAEKGFVITSGLASGIDTACHQGALLTQGKTLAVMGTGVNQIYPQSNKLLAQKIMQQGAIISEFPLNTPPAAWNFPRRNRIISGLSLGVLVVEAALRSGSLITARCALEQNREVFAIPGSIHHSLSRGCHQLIRQGAKLVESAQDIVEECGPLVGFMGGEVREEITSFAEGGLAADEEKVVSFIDYSATGLDLIQQRSRLTTSELSSILLLLELKGTIQAVPGGYIRLIEKGIKSNV